MGNVQILNEKKTKCREVETYLLQEDVRKSRSYNYDLNLVQIMKAQKSQNKQKWVKVTTTIERMENARKK